jgi:hypothetical protein
MHPVNLNGSLWKRKKCEFSYQKPHHLKIMWTWRYASCSMKQSSYKHHSLHSIIKFCTIQMYLNGHLHFPTKDMKIRNLYAVWNPLDPYLNVSCWIGEIRIKNAQVSKQHICCKKRQSSLCTSISCRDRWSPSYAILWLVLPFSVKETWMI